jgi:aminotransferase
MHLGDGAFYAILDVSAHAQGDPLALAIALAEKEDVIVVPGTAFGPTGQWFWRLSYASGAAAVGEGMARIARFLGG